MSDLHLPPPSVDADAQRIEHALTTLQTGGSSTQPRLHKPLLVTYLLWQYWRTGQTTYAYDQARPVLTKLLTVTPGILTPRPQYPWWRLRKDPADIWHIEFADEIPENSVG